MRFRRLLSLLAWLALAAAGSARADSAPPPSLSAARINAAAEAYRTALARQHSAMDFAETVYQWSLRWYNASREAGVAGAAAEHLSRMQTLLSDVKMKYSTGAVSKMEVDGATYYVAEAAFWAAGKNK